MESQEALRTEENTEKRGKFEDRESLGKPEDRGNREILSKGESLWILESQGKPEDMFTAKNQFFHHSFRIKVHYEGTLSNLV